MAEAAYYNLSVAAVSTVPVIASGLLAWHWQLEGQKLKGTLLFHLVLGSVASGLIWLVWSIHLRVHRHPGSKLPMYRLPIEIAAVFVVTLPISAGFSAASTSGHRRSKIIDSATGRRW